VLQPATLQTTPVKMYRTPERLTVSAPMPGIEPENITVEITQDDRLILHGELRASLKDAKEVLLDEWRAGGYHRELALPNAVDGSLGNVTYGNGVIVVALPLCDQTRPARLRLETIGQARGERVGNSGHPVLPRTIEEHRAAKAVEQAQHGGAARSHG
jgi:HSP20 family protein